MKLFDKVVKHSRAYGIGESLVYANGVPLACPWRTPIVPQLSKCLKFEAVWGVLTD